MTYRERLLIVALEDSVKAQRSLQKALFEYADRTEEDTYADKPSEEKTHGGQYIPVVTPPEVPVAGTQEWPVYPPEPYIPYPVPMQPPTVPGIGTTGPYAPPGATIYCSSNIQEATTTVQGNNEDTPL